MQLAVLGHPLTFTLSPQLHRAGLEHLGLEGGSRAIPTSVDRLPATLNVLAREGLGGVNLTHPLKEPVLEHLAHVSDAARRARSVNTVGFDAAGWWGETTDGPGFLEFLDAVGASAAAERVIFLGAGGAARSLAASLVDRGARVTAVARDPGNARQAWEGLDPVRFATWGENGWALLREASLMINATPLSGPRSDLPVDGLPDGILAVDLVYGQEPTAWVEALRSRGVRAYDGLGLLVHQARLSLQAWTGRTVSIGALAQAVDWTP